nr:hypothetical protein TetV2_00500 [Oceanusvirus sp.]
MPFSFPVVDVKFFIKKWHGNTLSPTQESVVVPVSTITVLRAKQEYDPPDLVFSVENTPSRSIEGEMIHVAFPRTEDAVPCRSGKGYFVSYGYREDHARRNTLNDLYAMHCKARTIQLAWRERRRKKRDRLMLAWVHHCAANVHCQDAMSNVLQFL